MTYVYYRRGNQDFEKFKEKKKLSKAILLIVAKLVIMKNILHEFPSSTIPVPLWVHNIYLFDE